MAKAAGDQDGKALSTEVLLEKMHGVLPTVANAVAVAPILTASYRDDPHSQYNFVA